MSVAPPLEEITELFFQQHPEFQQFHPEYSKEYRNILFVLDGDPYTIYACESYLIYCTKVHYPGSKPIFEIHLDSDGEIGRTVVVPDFLLSKTHASYYHAAEETTNDATEKFFNKLKPTE
jgi:hypothetical protein